MPLNPQHEQHDDQRQRAEQEEAQHARAGKQLCHGERGRAHGYERPGRVIGGALLVHGGCVVILACPHPLGNALVQRQIAAIGIGLPVLRRGFDHWRIAGLARHCAIGHQRGKQREKADGKRAGSMAQRPVQAVPPADRVAPHAHAPLWRAINAFSIRVRRIPQSCMNAAGATACIACV